MYDRWGRFVYRNRWAVLVVSAVLLGLSVAGILTGGTLAGNGGFGANLAAGQTANLISAEIQPEAAPTGSTTGLIFFYTPITATHLAYPLAVPPTIAPPPDHSP